MMEVANARRGAGARRSWELFLLLGVLVAVAAPAQSPWVFELPEWERDGLPQELERIGVDPSNVWRHRLLAFGPSIRVYRAIHVDLKPHLIEGGVSECRSLRCDLWPSVVWHCQPPGEEVHWQVERSPEAQKDCLDPAMVMEPSDVDRRIVVELVSAVAQLEQHHRICSIGRITTGSDGEYVVTEAVVAAVTGTLADEARAIAALKAELAGFKVPKRLLAVDELPRNSMGKVQKNRLRERYAALFDPAA